jgi:hypothetical protein
MGNEGDEGFEVPAEQEPAAAATERESAAQASMVGLGPGGLRVGDFVFRAVPALATDSTHDNQQNEDRARAREGDARAAQHAGAGGPVPGASGPGDGGGPDGQDGVPIILRDPVTGEPIGTL